MAKRKSNRTKTGEKLLRSASLTFREIERADGFRRVDIDVDSDSLRTYGRLNAIDSLYGMTFCAVEAAIQDFDGTEKDFAKFTSHLNEKYRQNRIALDHARKSLNELRQLAINIQISKDGLTRSETLQLRKTLMGKFPQPNKQQTI